MAQDEEATPQAAIKVRIYGEQQYVNPANNQLETRRDGRDLVVEIPRDRFWDIMPLPNDSPEVVERKRQYQAEAFDQFYGTGRITRDDFRHIGGAVGGIGGGVVGGAPGAIAGSTAGGMIMEGIAQLTEPRQITGGGVTMNVLGVPRETYLMFIGPDEPSEGRENLTYEDRLNIRNPWGVDVAQEAVGIQVEGKPSLIALWKWERQVSSKGFLMSSVQERREWPAHLLEDSRRARLSLLQRKLVRLSRVVFRLEAR
jgi:hypothetical protein